MLRIFESEMEFCFPQESTIFIAYKIYKFEFPMRTLFDLNCIHAGFFNHSLQSERLNVHHKRCQSLFSRIKSPYRFLLQFNYKEIFNFIICQL